MEDRYEKLQNWIEKKLYMDFFMQEIKNDASFRSYYRVFADEFTFIACDMPPDKEDPRAFKAITTILLKNKVRAPFMFSTHVVGGLFLLEDFGDTTYLRALSDDNADSMYKLAIDELLKIQNIKADDLPPYDRTLLLEEMHLFTDWYCKRHLDIKFTAEDEKIISQSYDCLVENALEQPQVFVHRDYHSRNLMFCDTQAVRALDYYPYDLMLYDNHSIGMLDYQDAVLGPITYDLVSLLRDCYIEWQHPQVLKWLHYFLEHTPYQLDEEQFLRWFDLMTIQRHLKTTGIFARLNLRDNKPAYMDSIPRNLRYIKQAIERHPELAELGKLIEKVTQ